MHNQRIACPTRDEPSLTPRCHSLSDHLLLESHISPRSPFARMLRNQRVRQLGVPAAPESQQNTVLERTTACALSPLVILWRFSLLEHATGPLPQRSACKNPPDLTTHGFRGRRERVDLEKRTCALARRKPVVQLNQSNLPRTRSPRSSICTVPPASPAPFSRRHCGADRDRSQLPPVHTPLDRVIDLRSAIAYTGITSQQLSLLLCRSSSSFTQESFRALRAHPLKIFRDNKLSPPAREDSS